MATVYFKSVSFVCLAGLKLTLVLRGFLGSEVYFLCFNSIFVCFCKTQRSGVHPSCMSPSESEGKKGGFCSPSTCLLPAEHVISHHNSGLLPQIQQSAWPGPREHSMTDIRTHNKTVSPFSLFLICRHGYHTKCEASDACYRWQKTVPEDGTCICLPAWLADYHSTKKTK